MTFYKNYKRHCLLYYSLFILPVFLTCLPVTLDHPALNIDVPSEWEDEAIVILSDSTELEIKESGKKNILFEKCVVWYKINKTNPDDLKTYSLDYGNEKLEKEPHLNIRAFYNNDEAKSILDIKTKNDLKYNYSLSGNRSGENRKIVNIDDYSKLRYLRIEEKRCYVQPEYLCYSFVIRRNYNIIEKVITFKADISYHLNLGFENVEQINATVKNFTKGNDNVFQITAHHIPLISAPHCKYPEHWYAAFYASLPPKGKNSYSWVELGDYKLKCFSDSLKGKDTAFLDSVSKTIPLGGVHSQDDIISKTFNFVKDNIRYYGSWEELYGWIPRDPKTIFEKGYGDCKEMATILTYLLRKNNINAWPSLVCVNDFQYLEKYPTITSYGHLISCAETSDGKILYLDATDKLATSETSYFRMIGQKTFVLKENASFPDIIKPTENYQNRIITESTVSPSPNGWSIKGKAQISGELAHSIYQKIKVQENTDLNKLLRDQLKSILKINPIDINLQTNTPTEIIITYSADFTQCFLQTPAKGLVFTIPSVYTPNYKYCDLSYEGNRYLSKIEQTDRWIIPPEFTKYNFSNFEHQYGKGVWISSQNTITRTYSCEFAHIDASDRDNLKKFFNERSNFEQGIAWAK